MIVILYGLGINVDQKSIMEYHVWMDMNEHVFTVNMIDWGIHDHNSLWSDHECLWMDMMLL